MRKNDDKQINIKFTQEEFDIMQTLKKKYAINISQFIKICLLKKLEKMEKEGEGDI